MGHVIETLERMAATQCEPDGPWFSSNPHLVGRSVANISRLEASVAGICRIQCLGEAKL